LSSPSLPSISSPSSYLNPIHNAKGEYPQSSFIHTQGCASPYTSGDCPANQDSTLTSNRVKERSVSPASRPTRLILVPVDPPILSSNMLAHVVLVHLLRHTFHTLSHRAARTGVGERETETMISASWSSRRTVRVSRLSASSPALRSARIPSYHVQERAEAKRQMERLHSPSSKLLPFRDLAPSNQMLTWRRVRTGHQDAGERTDRGKVSRWRDPAGPDQGKDEEEGGSSEYSLSHPFRRLW
jgi:hypothetical protein